MKIIRLRHKHYSDNAVNSALFFLFFNLVIFEPYDKKLVQRSLDGLGYLPSVIGEQKLIEVSDKVYPRWIRRGE
jgi:hypothetical protein